MTPEREIMVALTVDTDSDEYFGNLSDVGLAAKPILGWRGFDEGRKLLVDAAGEFQDDFGCAPRFTWFVRCDGQIAREFGDAAYLLLEYRDWWDARLAKGDQVAWHPHLYRRHEGSWIQETDPGCLAHDIESSFAAFGDAGYGSSAARLGEAYQTNETMRALSDLGLRADSSGIPGRRRDDGQKSFDWETTPNAPYRPSSSDYRLPGDPALPIWEIPMNTVMTRTSYDRVPLRRYVNLAFVPGLLNDGLANFMVEHDVLVSITHPFELMPEFFRDGESDAHPLLAFTPRAVADNVAAIARAVELSGRRFRFVTVDDILARLEADE